MFFCPSFKRSVGGMKITFLKIGFLFFSTTIIIIGGEMIFKKELLKNVFCPSFFFVGGMKITVFVFVFVFLCRRNENFFLNFVSINRETENLFKNGFLYARPLSPSWKE